MSDFLGIFRTLMTILSMQLMMQDPDHEILHIWAIVQYELKGFTKKLWVSTLKPKWHSRY